MGIDFEEVPNKQGMPEKPQSWGHRFLWLLASFILPVFSLRFYRIAQRKSVFRALIFFISFATALSALFTIRAARILSEIDTEIQTSLSSGDFPTITIRNGVASVDAPQPLVILDQQGQLFALDTSGQLTDIDPERYREGILLTRNQLIVLDNTGQRQSLQLGDLNELFAADPIVIDQDFILKAWDRFSKIAIVLAGLGLWVWHFFVRMLTLTLVGLLIWGSISVLRNQTSYNLIMITGLYAVVPALYLHYLLGRVGLTLPGLQTMILMLIWMGISIATLNPVEMSSSVQELNLLKMTPIGIPMLIVLAWDVVFTPEIDPLALWGVPTLTLVAWIVMRRFQGEEDQPTSGLG
jgi:hypothetical protein